LLKLKKAAYESYFDLIGLTCEEVVVPFDESQKGEGLEKLDLILCYELTRKFSFNYNDMNPLGIF